MITRDDRSLSCTALVYNSSCANGLILQIHPWDATGKHNNHLMVQKLLLRATLRPVSAAHPSSIVLLF